MLLEPKQQNFKGPFKVENNLLKKFFLGDMCLSQGLSIDTLQAISNW
jgi:hypothetical protein